MTVKQLQLPFFIALFIAILVLAFQIFKPLLPVLAVAAMFAVILHPAQARLVKLLRGHDGISAAIIVAISALILMIPLSFLGTQVYRETNDLLSSLTTNGSNYVDLFNQYIGESLRRYFPNFDPDIPSYVEQALGWIAGNLGQIFSGAITTVLYIFLGFIALYYFLKDGKRFAQSIMELSPLADTYDREIAGRLEQAINSVVKGSLLIALIQGVLTGIGFTIFGVPNPALWGTIAAIGALIPGVGTTIVLLPAILYLFFTGQTIPGLGLTIWGATAVGLIDNLLGPSWVGRGANIHPLLVLFSVIGGIAFFGPLGFFLGPLVLSLLYALVDIYRLLILKKAPVITPSIQ